MYYRILTVNKETKRQILSPFVFPEDEALKRCKVFNFTRRKANHIPLKVESPREMEIWNYEDHGKAGPQEIDMNVKRLKMANIRLGRTT